LAVPAETKSIRFRPLHEDWQYLGENQSEKILIVNRRQFNLGMTAAMLSLSAIPQRLGASAQLDTEEPGRPATPSGAKHSSYFFKHPTFEYVFLVSLGRAYQMGKVLYLSKQIEDGNFESAYQTFKQAGDEARALAEESASQGHKESARQAYLWAQNFYDSSTYFVDNSHDPDRFLPTWELLYDCWLKTLSLFDPPVEPISIPYENTELHGFFFRGTSTSRARRLLILINGSDGSLLDMWTWGGAGALARGYDCLTFDGPGQGYALWKQNLHFRPDWEKVIMPVVDYALSRKEVDPKRIAIQGISQGGYWVARAVAFEKRIAGAIADPGVIDVSSSWSASLPKPMLELLKAGRRAEFDGYMSKTLDPATKADLRFRMRPYGFTSYYDTFKAVQEYNLEGIVAQIGCPMLITEPVNEAFWPGQSRQLYDLLSSPKKLVPFSESDGADLHCEPKGTGLRDLRVFNWLDEILA
jgi:pimeloyl-ACP methyl ester carboxylesterase